MSYVNQPGTFRGDVLDRGLVDAKGYTQLEISFKAKEKWNDQEEVWEDWSQYDETEFVGRLTLFAPDKPWEAQIRQAMKVFGWDGMSIAALQEAKPGETAQFRVGFGKGDYADRLGLDWLDTYDAEPGRKVRKLEVNECKALDAKWMSKLRTMGGGPKPKSAKPPAPPVAQPPVSTDPTSGATPAPAPSVSSAGPAPAPQTEAGAATTEPPKKRGRPAAPKPPATPPPPTVPGSSVMSKADAWSQGYTKAHDAGKTDVEIGQAFTAAAYARGGDEAIGADWSGVYSETLTTLGV